MVIAVLTPLISFFVLGFVPPSVVELESVVMQIIGAVGRSKIPTLGQISSRALYAVSCSASEHLNKQHAQGSNNLVSSLHMH